MKNNGCLNVILIFLVSLLVISQIKIGKTYEYEIVNDPSTSTIVIDSWTETTVLNQTNGKQLLFDNNKTFVDVDSLSREITIGEFTFKFKK